MHRRILPGWFLLLGLAGFAGAAMALDAVQAEPPAPVADRTIRIGSRTLHLPAGQWTFIAHRVKAMTGRGRGRGFDAVDAWFVRSLQERFNLAVHLSLPATDGPGIHEWGEDPCAIDDNILRQDLSRGLTLPECLAIIGHRSMLSALEGRAPGVHRWLAARQFPEPGPVVQFAYRERASGTFGAVSLYFAADCFPGDDDARQWARGLREVFRPLFEGRQMDADLPALPSTEGACRAVDAATPMPAASAPRDD